MASSFDRARIFRGIVETAKALGIDPIDLGTIISYETAGTFNPKKAGPTTKWGKHRGLIQFGEPQAKQFGVNWRDPIGSQLGPDGAIVKYFRDRGVQPGMGLTDLYSIVNAGGPGLSSRSDAATGGAPGTVADKVRSMGDHRAKAQRSLKPFLSGDPRATSTHYKTSTEPPPIPATPAPQALPLGQAPQISSVPDVPRGAIVSPAAAPAPAAVQNFNVPPGAGNLPAPQPSLLGPPGFAPEGFPFSPPETGNPLHVTVQPPAEPVGRTGPIDINEDRLASRHPDMPQVTPAAAPGQQVSDGMPIPRPRPPGLGSPFSQISPDFQSFRDLNAMGFAPGTSPLLPGGRAVPPQPIVPMPATGPAAPAGGAPGGFDFMSILRGLFGD